MPDRPPRPGTPTSPREREAHRTLAARPGEELPPHWRQRLLSRPPRQREADDE